MKDFLAYLKVLIIEQWRPPKSSDRKKYIVAYIVLGICFAPILVTVFIGLLNVGKVAAQLNVTIEVLTIIITICQGMVIVFGLISMLNTIYFSKDSEIVLGLPMKPATIFSAKLGLVYINELLTALLVGLVAMLPFGIGAGVGVGYYFGLVLVILLTPTIPLLISAIVAIPLMYIVSFFKNKGILSTIALIIIFGGFFVAYYLFINQLASGSPDGGGSVDFDAIIAQATEQLKVIAQAIFPNYMLAKVALASSVGMFIISFLCSVGMGAVLVAIAVLISSAVYRNSISKQLENNVAKSSAKGKFEAENKTMSCIKTDLKKIIRFPSLGFYCLMQLVMAPIMIWFMLYTFSSEEGMTELIIQMSDIFAVVAISMCFLFVISLNYVAMSAITRENDNYYIYKILPTDFKIIMEAKVALAMIFNVLALIVSVVIMGIMLPSINILYLFAIFIITFVFGCAASYLQVYFDLRKPKLNWKSVSEGLKNNSASLWSLLIGLVLMVVVGGLGGLCIYLSLVEQIQMIMPLFYCVITIIGLVCVYFMRKLLLDNCEQLLRRIEE